MKNKTNKIMKTAKKHTYDVHFNSDETSDCKGFASTFEYCRYYIANNSGDECFQAYAGGYVSIVCNETGETVFEEIIHKTSKSLTDEG